MRARSDAEALDQQRGDHIHSQRDQEAVMHQRTASERRGINLNGFKDFRTDNGSSQGQNLALNGLFVPSSHDSGTVHGPPVVPNT